MKRTLILVAVAAALIAGAVNAATIVGAAQQAGNFTKLLAASKAAGIDKTLEGPGPFTLFAPNDAAFAKVPQAKLDRLMMPGARNVLKTALGAHLVTGIVSMQAIDTGLAGNAAVVVDTVNRMPLVFKNEGGGLTVNGAHIIGQPMQVDNGLIYVIDTVLVPPMPLQPKY